MRRLRRALSSRAARLLDQSVAAAIFSSILHGATLPTEGWRGGGRRDGLDWWPAKGPRRPPGPGPLRTLSARSSPRLSSAPAQDDVEGPATDSTPGLDPRARPRGDPDTFGRCGHRDHLSDHRDASLARLSQEDGLASTRPPFPAAARSTSSAFGWWICRRVRVTKVSK